MCHKFNYFISPTISTPSDSPKTLAPPPLLIDIATDRRADSMQNVIEQETEYSPLSVDRKWNETGSRKPVQGEPQCRLRPQQQHFSSSCCRSAIFPPPTSTAVIDLSASFGEVKKYRATIWWTFPIKIFTFEIFARRVCGFTISPPYSIVPFLAAWLVVVVVAAAEVLQIQDDFLFHNRTLLMSEQPEILPFRLLWNVFAYQAHVVGGAAAAGRPVGEAKRREDALSFRLYYWLSMGEDDDNLITSALVYNTNQPLRRRRSDCKHSRRGGQQLTLLSNGLPRSVYPFSQ